MASELKFLGDKFFQYKNLYFNVNRSFKLNGYGHVCECTFLFDNYLKIYWLTNFPLDYF